MTIPVLNFDNFDPTVPPTQDLFRHVNGHWLATTRIPADRGSWGTFDELSENSQQAVREIIDGLPSDADPTTEEGKIAGLYGSFMAADEVEAKGIAPLEPLLARADAIASVNDLAAFWGWSVRHGITALGGFDNDADPGDPNRYLMFVGQSGIGLPDEEYYRADQHARIREQYLTHIATSFTLAGITDAEQQAQDAFQLETAIASCHWDKVRTRDMVQMYYPQTWEQFTADSPALEWAAFLAGAELPESAVAEVVNAQRTFFPDVQKFVTPDSLPAWRSWARWQVVRGMSPYLTEALATQSWEFYSHTLRGVPEQRPRWKRGVSLAEGVLGEAIGKLYVVDHFPPNAKQACQQLVGNLLEAYRRSITDLDWMTQPTKEEALRKLSKFRAKIGYPDKWRDYSALRIDPHDLAGNVLRADSFDFDHTIEQLSGPVDKDEWFMFPQTVNAYYHPLRNEIVFPAAILQPPFFNVDADDAVNYGGIGGVIGHEIGHGFDDQGSTCDGDGRLRNWWTDEDRAAFEARTHALIAQYNRLSPSVTPDVTVNGELTIGENIGDLGGLSIAIKAWRIARESARSTAEHAGQQEPDVQPEQGTRRGTPAGAGATPAHRDAETVGETDPAATDPETIDGYTGMQRLFLGWAQSWRDITRPEQMRQRIAVDPHSPDEIRCNQVARNLPEFQEAFGTKPGDAMWLAPEERVRIW